MVQRLGGVKIAFRLVGAGTGRGLQIGGEVLGAVREPGGALVSRSHFKEKQVGLSDNLMNFDTFLKRGAKWLTAQELAMEGMQKMIKEFGL